MMAPSNFNLRGISPEVMAILKREAYGKKISLNLLILQLIEQGIGFSKKTKKMFIMILITLQEHGLKRRVKALKRV